MLGLWIEQTEGAKFWLKVVNELKARGVNDILIAVVDGLKGFPEAITSVFPQTVVQTCIVHLIRNSLAFVSWKDRKAILPAIKAIYRAENADMALVRLEEFEAEWGKRYPAIGQAWRRAWEHVVPFFAFAPGIRKMIYTTNAVEALHRSLAQDHQDPRQLSQRRCRVEAALSRHQECRHALATRRRMDRRHGPVCHPVRRAFSRNGAMIRAAQSGMKTTEPMVALSRQTRWPEYGRPASPVKAGLRPPPSAANGLDRACCPALVGHQAFDGGVRLMQEQPHFNLHRSLLHKISDIPTGASP